MHLILIFALITFNPIIEVEQVQTALEEHYPGETWNIKEFGDGNINYIYRAENTQKGKKTILVKKALDYARIDPVAFPLPIGRLSFEHQAYVEYQKSAPDRIPEIYFYDEPNGMLAMEYLSPHIILRRGLLEGKKYPLLAEHLGSFLGRSLYLTSKYHLSDANWQENVAYFADNTEMRKIIENLNFTHPFQNSTSNRWTSPELDDIVLEIQQDSELKSLVHALKRKFLNFPEALSHGDLHTGSVLVTKYDTRVFDTEFASYAPISFDIGMLLANYAMASIASEAHGTDKIWLSSLISSTWESFETSFTNLWANDEISVDEKIQEIWQDTVRLMGVEIIRRTIGVAHNADFEKISDRPLKAQIEREALEFARELILESSDTFTDAYEIEARLVS